MRHLNPMCSSSYPFYNCKKHSVNIPYNTQYIESYQKTKFRNTANSNRSYVKILQFVADHDGCTRAEIQVGVGYYESMEAFRNDPNSRGYNSAFYAQLLYIDLIDYDKNYKYHITEKGREVLEFAKINDSKMVTE